VWLTDIGKERFQTKEIQRKVEPTSFSYHPRNNVCILGIGEHLLQLCRKVGTKLFVSDYFSTSWEVLGEIMIGMIDAWSV